MNLHETHVRESLQADQSPRNNLENQEEVDDVQSADIDGSNSPPRSVKVINYDEDEEVRSFPLYDETD